MQKLKILKQDAQNLDKNNLKIQKKALTICAITLITVGKSQLHTYFEY